MEFEFAGGVIVFGVGVIAGLLQHGLGEYGCVQCDGGGGGGDEHVGDVDDYFEVGVLIGFDDLDCDDFGDDDGAHPGVNDCVDECGEILQMDLNLNLTRSPSLHAFEHHHLNHKDIYYFDLYNDRLNH